MNFIFRLLLTLNATSLLIIIFVVQKGYTLECFFTQSDFLKDTPNFVSYVIYLSIPCFLTGTTIKLSSCLGKEEFEHGEVVSLEHANNSFLPSYLGYFFVALSIQNIETLVVVYGLLFVFTFLSQALYFNPLFLIFGFEFYNIKTKNGLTVFLISREKYKTPKDICIPTAYKINNHTFIERS